MQCAVTMGDMGIDWMQWLADQADENYRLQNESPTKSLRNVMPQKATRKCINFVRCGNTLPSTGFGNRVCPKCMHKQDRVRGYGEYNA